MTDLSEATRPAASAATGPRPLTAKNYLAYAAGDADNQIAFTMSGMFLTPYYTASGA
jgi:glucuronide carrier protein